MFETILRHHHEFLGKISNNFKVSTTGTIERNINLFLPRFTPEKKLRKRGIFLSIHQKRNQFISKIRIINICIIHTISVGYPINRPFPFPHPWKSENLININLDRIQCKKIIKLNFDLSCWKPFFKKKNFSLNHKWWWYKQTFLIRFRSC
jgi:hypothetical protein